MDRRIALLLSCVFLLGWLSSIAYSEVHREIKSYRYSLSLDDPSQGILEVSARDVPSPQDRISESQIHVMSDRIVIEIQGAKWSKFTDTKSMDPVLDSGANGIHIVPGSPDEIHVGDVVAYRSYYMAGTVIHRVVQKGEDEQGVYFILKGDNNPRADPGRVRFEQIERVLVAIIY